ncbi:Gfo/Idh/MocA family oxidoreductase [Candidatus Sumerlaeota bacterium]|nr:Gfo/Idh/MocA family oxidoreductase [Candidatus Sumerlaeota bacterium]
MDDLRKLSRRNFLAGGATAAAGGLAAPHLVPASALAAPGRPGPNDRIGVGYIGVGRRGMQLSGLPAAGQIVGVCDIDRNRAQAAAARLQCPPYTDYRKMLEAKDVDAVLVATPDHWHALVCIRACQAGKDVYCEKPLGLTVREGRAMLDAARKYGRVFQVGMQRRSSSAYRIGCALAREGRLGKVHTVIGPNYPSPWLSKLPAQPVPDGLDWDVWCGQTEPVPFNQDIYIQRARPGWISLQPYSGGEMTGTGAHTLDIVHWALGADHTGPVEVWAEGGKLEPVVYSAPEDRNRGDAHCSRGHQVAFRYANGVTMKLDDATQDWVFLGDKGKMTIANEKITTDPPEIAAEALKGVKKDGPASHLQNWLDCIKSRERPNADVEIGHCSTTVCHLGNIARWVGRKLRWDHEKEIFPGDDEANGYLERPMRKPYELPRTL